MPTQNTDSVVEQAQLLINQGHEGEAVLLLNEVCNSSNQSPVHWRTFGIARAKSGDLSQTIPLVTYSMLNDTVSLYIKN